eukprot:IDg3876t1
MGAVAAVEPARTSTATRKSAPSFSGRKTWVRRLPSRSFNGSGRLFDSKNRAGTDRSSLIVSPTSSLLTVLVEIGTLAVESKSAFLLENSLGYATEEAQGSGTVETSEESSCAFCDAEAEESTMTVYGDELVSASFFHGVGSASAAEAGKNGGTCESS